MTTLIGSQKQVSWASRIRDNFIADGMASIAGLAPDAAAEVDRAVAAAARQPSARFWIDNYGRRTGDSWGSTAAALAVRS